MFVFYNRTKRKCVEGLICFVVVTLSFCGCHDKERTTILRDSSSFRVMYEKNIIEIQLRQNLKRGYPTTPIYKKLCMRNGQYYDYYDNSLFMSVIKDTTYCFEDSIEPKQKCVYFGKAENSPRKLPIPKKERKDFYVTVVYTDEKSPIHFCDYYFYDVNYRIKRIYTFTYGVYK